MGDPAPGSTVARITADDRLLALSHPTRRALVESLSGQDEASTVQLEKSTEVTRYHLYHHLNHLVKGGWAENHRDQGRARWWRLTEAGQQLVHVAPVPLDAAARTAPVPPGRDPEQESEDRKQRARAMQVLEQLPPDVVSLLEDGARLRWLRLGDDATSLVNARKTLEAVATERGLDLDLPFTFMPAGMLILSAPPRR